MMPVAFRKNRLLQLFAILGFAGLGLSGCVTETTGGLPPPASVEARVVAQLDLVRGYIEQGDLIRAKPPLAKALEIDPEHVEARVLNAVVLQAQNEYELAEENYLAALRVNPTHAQALNNYAAFLYSRARYNDAIAVLEKLVLDTSYRARPQAFENLGLAQVQAGATEAAQRSFQRALELNFRQPRSSLELAAIAFEQKDFSQAQSQLITYRAYARPTARSLCLSLKVATALNNADEIGSYGIALKNMFPKEAAQCRI